MMTEGLKAVLTGEVIQTSRMSVPARQVLPDLLARALESCELPSVRLSAEVLGLQFFQEGRFQAVLDDAEAGLPAALHMIAWLGCQTVDDDIPVQVRVAIGVGPLDYLDGQVNLFDHLPRRMFRGGGKAFMHSNRLLRVMETGDRRIGLRTPWQDANAELKVACLFLDFHIKRWSTEQAKTILALISGRNQHETAQILGISQPAVAQRFRRAGGQAVRALLRRYGAILKNAST